MFIMCTQITKVKIATNVNQINYIKCDLKKINTCNDILLNKLLLKSYSSIIVNTLITKRRFYKMNLRAQFK